MSRAIQLTEGQLRYRKYKNTYKKYAKTHKQKYYYYPENNNKYRFSGNRLTALKRDNYCCVICGLTNQKHIDRWGSTLTVHHIDGNGKNKKRQEKNNRLENLQTLCLSCHGKIDSRLYTVKLNGKMVRKYKLLSTQ